MKSKPRTKSKPGKKSQRCFLMLLLATLIISQARQSNSFAQDKAVGKDKKGDTTQTKKFDKKGLMFDYPDQWKIGSDESFSGTRLVIVHGPNNAIMTIQLSESKFADSIEEYSKEYSKTAADEVRKVAELTEESLSKKRKNKFDYEVISEKFTIETGETKVPHNRIYFRKEMGKYACFIVCQSATANLEAVESGFRQLITTIKLRTSKKVASKKKPNSKN